MARISVDGARQTVGGTDDCCAAVEWRGRNILGGLSVQNVRPGHDSAVAFLSVSGCVAETERKAAGMDRFWNCGGSIVLCGFLGTDSV